MDVEESTFGGYVAYVDMEDPNRAFAVYDVYFAVADELALNLAKNSPVTFSGYIESAHKTLGTLSIK